MELILNELSLHGQFESIDDFSNYTVEILSKVLQMIEEKSIILYKKSDVWSRNITCSDTLYDILSISFNNPAIYLIKRHIREVCENEPFWDINNQSKTVTDAIYAYSGKTDEPNCITEAIERRIGIFSFPSEYFGERYIRAGKNDHDYEVSNIKNQREFLDHYIHEEPEEIRYVMEHYPYQKLVTLHEVNGRCYAKEAILENNLIFDDIKSVIHHIDEVIVAVTGSETNRFCKLIEAKIYEYRLSVSDGREFRLFFTCKDGMVLLNGFIKKQQQTPRKELELARKLCGLIT